MSEQAPTLEDFSGTIKPGAVVWQDCVPFCFDSEYGADACRIVFRFKQTNPNRFKGVADGFGSFDGKYGNGAVYVNGEDIDGLPFVEAGQAI